MFTLVASACRSDGAYQVWVRVQTGNQAAPFRRPLSRSAESSLRSRVVVLPCRRQVAHSEARRPAEAVVVRSRHLRRQAVHLPSLGHVWETMYRPGCPTRRDPQRYLPAEQSRTSVMRFVIHIQGFLPAKMLTCTGNPQEDGSRAQQKDEDGCKPGAPIEEGSSRNSPCPEAQPSSHNKA